MACLVVGDELPNADLLEGVTTLTVRLDKILHKGGVAILINGFQP